MGGQSLFTYPPLPNLSNQFQAMKERIRSSSLIGGIIDPHVDGGHYELVGPDDEIILPRDWASIVEPGWIITLRMLPITKAVTPEKDETVVESNVADSVEVASPERGKVIKLIHFNGNTYRLSLNRCQTWEVSIVTFVEEFGDDCV